MYAPSGLVSAISTTKNKTIWKQALVVMMVYRLDGEAIVRFQPSQEQFPLPPQLRIFIPQRERDAAAAQRVQLIKPPDVLLRWEEPAVCADRAAIPPPGLAPPPAQLGDDPQKVGH